MTKSITSWLIIFLIFTSVIRSFGFASPKEVKNVLLINSYHQEYLWTDSLTSGVISALKLNHEITLHIEYLNSKQFGKSNFELEKNYFKAKYSEISFDGILVTDNDALDFAFQYDKELFPNKPIVFAGISNPEDYPLRDSQYYGFTETVNTDGVLDFVKKTLPNAKRLLILCDLTTTGLIYRKEFIKQAGQIKDFSVVFPEVIDLDSIYRMVSSAKDYDAIYYIGIGTDKNDRLIDFVSFLDSVCQLVKVPLFTNDPIFNGKGVVGGMYQSGKRQGQGAARLLVQLMDSNAQKPARRYFATELDYFFDRKVLDKYDIPLNRIPKDSKVINKKYTWNKENFIFLIVVMMILIFVVVVLSIVNRRGKMEQKRSNGQLLEIETQKNKLEEASEHLNRVIREQELTNEQLKLTNINLFEAKKKAEESDNLKSAFLANVSHEIRTPLNSIVGFSSLLSDNDLSEETRISYIELIESNTESLLVLIDEIIDLSKIEAQQLTIKEQNFSIDALMTELFQIFSHGQKDTKVELRQCKVSDNKELFVYSDRVRIKQIFINLLSNAFKFTDSGFIEMGYREAEDNKIQLYVSDSGIGIKEEHQEVIFDRFRKLNSDGNRIYRGTGLGLAITKKLVELLGGKIWIESEPGKGSVFIFTLKNLELKDSSA